VKCPPVFRRLLMSPSVGVTPPPTLKFHLCSGESEGVCALSDELIEKTITIRAATANFEIVRGIRIFTLRIAIFFFLLR
jgi:hypothetical protein